MAEKGEIPVPQGKPPPPGAASKQEQKDEFARMDTGLMLWDISPLSLLAMGQDVSRFVLFEYPWTVIGYSMELGLRAPKPALRTSYGIYCLKCIRLASEVTAHDSIKFNLFSSCIIRV